MKVLFIDNHLLVVLKPAGQLIQGDITGDLDLISEAKQYLKAKFNKPGNVFVGLVHRLDRPVSGVVVLARTSKAAARLSAQFRDRTVRKRYVAMVEGRVAEKFELRHHLLKVGDRTKVVKPGTRGSKEASMVCKPMLVLGHSSLVSIDLETGRRHQIRRHLAHLHHHILGDTSHGKGRINRDFREAFGLPRLCLHAWRLSIRHPDRSDDDTRLDVRAPLADDLRTFFSKLPGMPAGLLAEL